MRYHAVKLKRHPALLLLFIPVLVLSLLPLLRRGRAAAAMTGAVRVPVLMYHSVLDDGSRAGDYTVTTEVFREDMLWLREHGYTAVFVSELVDFADNGKPLPQNPVVVTLDDGYLNNLTCVLPVLEELDMKAVISVIGRYSAEFSETHDRSPSYAHLTWEDICVLAQSGHVEIANHSYDMHELSPPARLHEKARRDNGGIQRAAERRSVAAAEAAFGKLRRHAADLRVSLRPHKRGSAAGDKGARLPRGAHLR